MKRIMIDKMESSKRWGDYRNELPALEAEAEEARALARQDGMEVVFAFYWTDERGFKEGKTVRRVYATIDEAMDAYNAQKKGNGSYVQGWLEVRKAGEFQRMEKIKNELAKLTKELKALTGED